MKASQSTLDAQSTGLARVTMTRMAVMITATTMGYALDALADSNLSGKKQENPCLMFHESYVARDCRACKHSLQ